VSNTGNGEYNTSVTIEAAKLSQYRGKVAEVTVLGNNSGGASIESRDISATVNSRPAAPSLNLVKTVVPHTGTGKVLVEIANQGAHVGFRYSKTNSASATMYDTNEIFQETITISGSSATYYFWANNGEYSINSTPVTFYKNSTPSVTLSLNQEDGLGQASLSAVSSGG
jgi:hypothetical protein